MNYYKKILLIGLVLLLTNIQEAKGKMQWFPYISATEIYDNNVFLAPDGMKKEGDFITMITPGLSTIYDGKRIDLSINYRTALEFYSKLDENNSTNNHSGDLTLDYNVSKNIHFTVTDTLQFTAAENQLLSNDAVTFYPGLEGDAIEVPAEEAVNTILTSTPSDMITNTVHSVVSYTALSSLSLIAGHTHIITEYDSPSLTDTIEQGLNFESEYRLNNRNTINLITRYRNSIFDSMDNQETYFGEMNISHLFSSVFSGSISGGGFYNNEDNETGWTGRGDMTAVLKNGRIITEYERTLTPVRGQNSTSVTESYSITLALVYSQRLDSDFSVRYVNAESLSGEETGTDTISSTLDVQYLTTKKMSNNFSYSYVYQDYDQGNTGIILLHQFRIGAVYNWNEWLNINSSYSYSYRDSLVEDRPVRDNRISGGVSLRW